MRPAVPLPRLRVHLEAGGPAGTACGFGGQQRRIPEVGVEATAVDVVGFARDYVEELHPSSGRADRTQSFLFNLVLADVVS